MFKHFSLLVLAAMLAVSAYAQIREVKVFGGYAVSLNNRIGVTHAEAWGGGAELRIPIYEGIAVSIGGGYDWYRIQQPGDLDSWNWLFWIDWYKNMVNTNIRSDTNYAVILSTKQQMDAIPVYLTFNTDFEVFEDFYVRPSIGGGIYFYTKRLYLIEHWSKRFPTLNNYVFQYEFQNFAPTKWGNPLFAIGGLDIMYRLSESILLNGSMRYMQIVDLKHERNIEEMPFNSAMSLSLGLNFIY